MVEPFHQDMLSVQHWWDTLSVVIGAVDNAAARQSISAALVRNEREAALPRIWWLDCGNTKDAGQILLGSANKSEDLADTFATPGYCRKLPSPVVQHPELLIPLPEETANHHLSCAELLAVNAQSLMINQQVASYAAEMLYELLVTQQLKRFATY